MIMKILIYGGISFLILGFTTGDNMLYFFFAVHLLTLGLGFFLYKHETKRASKEKLPKEPKTASAK